MRSIQDVGKEILSGTPGPFYVFTGEEYGIKTVYLDLIEKKYGKRIESESVSSVLSLMETKHLVPLSPALYVVRYDEEFIASLNNSTEGKIARTKIVGTLVVLYEQKKHCDKADKYLSNYTVSIDSVNDSYVRKYLRNDFPEMDDRLISIAIQTSHDYNEARNKCRCMSIVPTHEINSLTDDEIRHIFGYHSLTSEDQIKIGVASKDFRYLMSAIEQYPGDKDSIFYTMLSTAVDLDKIISSKYSDSPLRQYSSSWTGQDIYYFFMQVYDQLKKSRSVSIDINNSLVYLAGLLQFSSVPSLEDME